MTCIPFKRDCFDEICDSRIVDNALMIFNSLQKHIILRLSVLLKEYHSCKKKAYDFARFFVYARLNLKKSFTKVSL